MNHERSGLRTKSREAEKQQCLLVVALIRLFEKQLRVAFDTGSLVGDFHVGGISHATSETVGLVGVVTMDGSGSLNGTIDVATSEGSTVNQTVNGRYTVESNGRGTLTLPSLGVNLVFYVVSTQSMVAIGVDAGVTQGPVLEFRQ